MSKYLKRSSLFITYPRVPCSFLKGRVIHHLLYLKEPFFVKKSSWSSSLFHCSGFSHEKKSQQFQPINYCPLFINRPFSLVSSITTFFIFLTHFSSYFDLRLWFSNSHLSFKTLRMAFTHFTMVKNHSCHTLAWSHSMIVPASLLWDCVDGTLSASSLTEAHIWLWKKALIANDKTCSSSFLSICDWTSWSCAIHNLHRKRGGPSCSGFMKLPDDLFHHSLFSEGI